MPADGVRAIAWKRRRRGDNLGMMAQAEAFSRYRQIVDDWEGFRRALERPLPRALWVNPLRADAGRLERALAAAGLEPVRVGWIEGAFRVPVERSPGSLLEYAAGLFHGQEEVSMIPVRVLDPRPGERVLDLCAAPGNKTLQMALAMRNRGTVVANDRDAGRLAPLRSHLYRMGAANVAVTRWDAASYPRASGLFDRVLADVPCSCEGTTRKSPEVLPRWHGDDLSRLNRLQGAILRRAIGCCRPGGRIVYATCTYAPEENEAVVDRVLRDLPPGTAKLLPARLPGLVASPGLRAWDGHHYVEGMELALRVWPHQNDTGGFFVALLERGETGADAEQTPPAALDEVDPERWWAPVADRYGFPVRVIDDWLLLRAGGRRLHLAPRSLRPPVRPEPVGIGLPFLRTDGEVPKLATPAAMLLGHRATRNLVALERPQAELFVRRRETALGEAQRVGCERGQVLVRFAGATLGVGILRSGGGGWRLESLFPKRWALRSGPPGAARATG